MSAKHIWLTIVEDKRTVQDMLEPYISRYRLFPDTEAGYDYMIEYLKHRGWPQMSMTLLDRTPGQKNLFMSGDELKLVAIRLPLPEEIPE